ncbi:PREDICTED: odorant receptor 43a-like isoform X1 [Vollenhovia emeryi]|uniref:odorant receptor 43a-like isoform X1 n=2 Tax=Vollenhovia emeryi TaxID=411798 RepID=UPI0005F5395B|nr:PREDICTED: odorant receptor 43a-like isoform X1 [Vollenhovia emeryi]
MKSLKYNGYRDFEWAVKLNRFILNLIGLWPETAHNSRQRLMCNFRVLVTFVGITFGLLIPSVHSLKRIFGDIILMIDNLQFTLPTISCSIRIAIFWWKKEAIVPIMNMIVEDWVKLKTAQERSVMVRKARIARIIITFAYCAMGIGCFFLIILPSFRISMRTTTNITDPGRPMPLQTYYIYDVTKSPLYELTFISQSIYIVVAMMSYSGIDNFLGLLVFHICGQLEILKNHLSNLDKYVNSHEKLKHCIIRHMRLLRAIDIIEDTYNVILLFLFIYFAALFAFYGFRIITLFDEGTDISFPHLMYFASTVINLFEHMCLYCALGEILVAQCNNIYYAVYSNQWYSMNPKATQNLLLLMIRGSKPVYLTAGKVFPLTMATFCSLVKTSVGYISVLHTTRS